MTSIIMKKDEKRALTSARQSAVRNAWKNEQERVYNGKGTRDWTVDQQKELLETGSVDGYEGHHMKSVSLYPEFAGDPNNIQFLNEDEHLYGAHLGSYHNTTNGYYDPFTKTMVEFTEGDLRQIPEVQLTEQYDIKQRVHEKIDYMGDLESPQDNTSEDYMGDLGFSEGSSEYDSSEYSISKDQGLE